MRAAMVMMCLFFSITVFFCINGDYHTRKALTIISSQIFQGNLLHPEFRTT